MQKRKDDYVKGGRAPGNASNKKILKETAASEKTYMVRRFKLVKEPNVPKEYKPIRSG